MESLSAIVGDLKADGRERQQLAGCRPPGTLRGLAQQVAVLAPYGACIPLLLAKASDDRIVSDTHLSCGAVGRHVANARTQTGNQN